MLTTVQAARKMNCDKSLIQRWIREDRIIPRPQRFGRMWMLAPDFTILNYRPRKKA